MNILKSPKNYFEDFAAGDNGMYQNYCLRCNAVFYGYKGRKLCHACYNQVDHRTILQKEKHKRLFLRIINKSFYNMYGIGKQYMGH